MALAGDGDSGRTFELPSTCSLVPQTPQLVALYTTIRCAQTRRAEFVFNADRIIRLLLEHALNYVPLVERAVTTPSGAAFRGLGFNDKICGISILRGGEAMEVGLRQIARSVRIGKILIQRDEKTARPTLYYAKLPADVASRWVLLLDPMLATGGSAITATQVLLDAGVRQERILYVSMFSCPEGIAAYCGRFPHARMIAGAIDAGLTADKIITPGVGDFGDLYFGTCD